MTTFRVRDVTVDFARPWPALPCHACATPTTRRGHFDRFDAADLPMCVGCWRVAKLGDRPVWWR